MKPESLHTMDAAGGRFNLRVVVITHLQHAIVARRALALVAAQDDAGSYLEAHALLVPAPPVELGLFQLARVANVHLIG